MAEKPIKTPLPADLPEDWNVGQTVAPDGTSVGLTEQHGYNYLMAAVNRAQRGVNEVNEAFETVSGKRTCRFVVGTAANGWTEADCDYLCDGTDDQVEIQAAIDALPATGGEIVLLDGTYRLSAQVSVSNKTNFVSITGNFGSTIISGDNFLFVDGSTLSVEKIVVRDFIIYGYNASLYVKDCVFLDGSVQVQNFTKEHDYSVLIDGCEFHSKTNPAIQVSGDEGTKLVASNNIIESEHRSGKVLLLFGGSQFVFSGNLIKCTGENSAIQNAHGFGIFIGNIVYNCNILVTASIVGNLLNGCRLEISNDQNSEFCVPVSGNSFEDATVSVAGNVSVTGNSFVINETSGTVNVIRLFQNGSLADDNLSPVIVGNYITGGSVGILLEAPNAAWNRKPSYALVSDNRIYGSQTPIKIDRYWSNCMVTDNLFATGSIVDNGTNNIIRFNSDDESGGGSGGVAGVTAFNGRSGRVSPASGDYTAAMVGAVEASSVKDIRAVTQAEYDALTTKDAATLYLIKE